MSSRAYLATIVIALLLVLVVGGNGIGGTSGSSDGPAKPEDANSEALRAALARNRAASERRLSARGPQHPATDSAADTTAGVNVSNSSRELSGGRFQRMPASNRSLDRMAAARERSSGTPLSVDAIGAASEGGRDWSFAWIRRDPGAPASLLEPELGRLDVQILRASGEYLLVRTPRTRDVLEAVSQLGGVSAFGAPRPEHKISDRLRAIGSTGVVGDELPVMITLVTDDDEGAWRQSLETKGVVIGDWHGDIRTYAANIGAAMLRTVAVLDFVAAIEPIEVMHATLESSVAVMGADGLRRFDEATGEFSGTIGESVAVGIVDTGLNARHRDVSAGRASVCGRNFYRDATEGDEDADMWFDYHGHGTHAAGILAGAGAGDSSKSGIAPGVRHIRAAKALSRSTSGDTTTVANAIQYLQSESACVWEGDESEPVRPLVVNLSLGSEGESDGRDAMNRKLDAAAWNSAQLLVLAAGNAGSLGVSPESASKNVLSVGAVTDPGVVASFSSHGPTADGRLAPHVVAAGFDVSSAQGGGKVGGYLKASGTSVAAPSVAGVAALLMDRHPDFRSRPEYARARLMATAVKPSAMLGPSLGINLDNSAGPGELQHEYGLGLVSARTAVAGGDDDAWYNDGDYLSVAADESYYVDIDIPEDSARLDIVLSWIEPPTESIAPKTLQADLNLYLDVGGDCADDACGEYASKSPVDNVEWLIVKEPPAGTHRLKVVPASDFAGSVWAGVAWTVIRDADTPNLTLSTEQPMIEVDAGSAFEIDLRLVADHYVAAGTTIHLACEGRFDACSGYADAVWWPVSEADREDGTTARIEGNVADAIALGEVWSGEEQRVVLAIPKRVATESHVLHFIASSWNAVADVHSVEIVVDSTDPSPASARPANDEIVDAVDLDDGDRVDFDLALATREPGEPMVRSDRSATSIKKFFSEYGPNDFHHPEPHSYAAHKSVWYAFHASAAGPVHLSWGFREDTEGHLSIYEGDAPTDWTRIADVQWGDRSRVDFVADAGTTYLVQLWTTSFDPAAGFLEVGRTPNVAPPNDDFADRIELIGDSGTVDGSNYRGTLESFEHYGETDAVSTWYSWTALDSGWWEVSHPSDFHVLVFEGSTPSSLRRVSDMPAGRSDAVFPAKEGTQYQLAVLNTGTDTPVPTYSLGWRKRLFVQNADNDMLDDAARIDGSTGSESVRRWYGSTVEPGEPGETGTGTQWWQWQAPEAETYVFRLDQRLHESMSVFTGTGFDDFEFLASGHSITLATEADTTYWLSVGFGPDSTYADLTESIYGNGFSWGRVPGNDLPSSATQLADAEGTVTSDHSFATAAGEPNDIMGHSSLWWEWQTPAAGWQRFALDDWKSMGLEYSEQQAIVAVYTTTDDGGLDLVATSDHSYVANGRAEAIFLADEGVSYVVRVALRATDLGSWSRETTFTYAPVDPPAWQRYVGRVVEAGDPAAQAVDDLDNPRGVALETGDNRLVVATERNLIVFEHRQTDLPTVSDVVPLRTADGEGIGHSSSWGLAWDKANTEMYLVAESGIFLVGGLDEGSRDATACELAESVATPNNLLIDSGGEYLYVLGHGGLEVYRRDDRCEFSRVQRYSLRNARSMAMGPGDGHIYIAAADTLVTLARDADTGEVASASELASWRWADNSYSWGWQDASVVLSGTGDHVFFVGGESPLVAVFGIGESLDYSPAEPAVVGVVEAYFLDPDAFTFGPPFFSHVASPWAAEGCAAIAAHDDSTAIDIVCDDQFFSVRWDADAEEAYVSDWFGADQADRFGSPLPRTTVAAPRLVAKGGSGSFNYVLVDEYIDSLQVLRRAEGIAEQPE